MKENKHTPGPWSILETEKHENFLRILAGNSQVAHVFPAYVNHKRSQSETEANAQLIASAPELVEALEKIDSILQGDMRDALHDESREAYQFIEQLRVLRGLNMTVSIIARQAIAR